MNDLNAVFEYYEEELEIRLETLRIKIDSFCQDALNNLELLKAKMIKKNAKKKHYDNIMIKEEFKKSKKSVKMEYLFFRCPVKRFNNYDNRIIGCVSYNPHKYCYY